MIDIGANLTSSRFQRDLDEALLRARQAGVETIIVTGASLESSRQAVAICNQYNSVHENGGGRRFPRLYSTAGIHPHHASEWDRSSGTHLRTLLADPHVVALGETGLDFNRNYSPPGDQETSFRAHLELACEKCTPMFLHERDAFDRQISLLDEYRDSLPGIVIHCFTGSAAALDAYLERGFYIGITGWVCDPRRGTELAGIVSRIPLERLMIETDAPYLLPANMPIDDHPGKSKRNEPSFLRWVLTKLAECYSLDSSVLADQTRRNAESFFGLDTKKAPL